MRKMQSVWKATGGKIKMWRRGEAGRRRLEELEQTIM
jgi:hypothetical protein